MVVRLAGDKAKALDPGAGTVVLGADTTVVLDGEVLGKPKNADDAARMLLSIAGRTHLVLTGWALAVDGAVIEDGFDSSLVSMHSVTEDEARLSTRSLENHSTRLVAMPFRVRGHASSVVWRARGAMSSACLFSRSCLPYAELA